MPQIIFLVIITEDLAVQVEVAVAVLLQVQVVLLTKVQEQDIQVTEIQAVTHIQQTVTLLVVEAAVPVVADKTDKETLAVEVVTVV